jgi:hypothetical protein
MADKNSIFGGKLSKDDNFDPDKVINIRNEEEIPEAIAAAKEAKIKARFSIQHESGEPEKTRGLIQAFYDFLASLGDSKKHKQAHAVTMKKELKN